MVFLRRLFSSPVRSGVVFGVVLSGVLAPRGAAQSGPAAASSTMSAVYTTAQATRGEETYMGLCVSCHPSGTYTGQPFRATWNGRPLSDLYDLIIESMPKQDPGMLTPKEAAQVIAYILKENRMPAGQTELPADSAALAKIKIELRR